MGYSKINTINGSRGTALEPRMYFFKYFIERCVKINIANWSLDAFIILVKNNFYDT